MVPSSAFRPHEPILSQPKGLLLECSTFVDCPSEDWRKRDAIVPMKGAPLLRGEDAVVPKPLLTKGFRPTPNSVRQPIAG
ncbi:unnamed protein product [Gongylonema pulchrum]|uniref:Uncharacterized protein n=1 Tax=Gongylonema pulchrum TaxID=637853 RepID=A0A183E1S4_9BILA|nr:unnamed protein product [Gongylonema pulchrum]